MVQTRTRRYDPPVVQTKEPPRVVLDSVESVDVPASKILSPDDLSTTGFDFGNIKLPKYSTQFIQREKGKRDVALALAPNPPELKENRQADQDIKWFEIYSDTPNTYQADLTFHKVRKNIGKKSGYVQQAIFCIININTRFAAAWPLQLVKKKNFEEAYTPTS